MGKGTSQSLDFLESLSTDSAQRNQKTLTWQRGLLRRCVRKSLDLDGELKAQGKSYDDLRYARDYLRAPRASRPPTLADIARHEDGIPVVSFFTGAGGLDLGFQAAGFSNVAAIEHDELFCSTLRHNHPGWHVIGPPVQHGDISRTEETVDALRAILGSRPFKGVFTGGPPCQPFSIAANQRFSKNGDNFKRVGFKHRTNGNLFFDFIELIKIFRPRVFLIENVPGLMDIDGGEQLRRACAELTTEGYSVAPPKVVDAADYGVPQHRRRLFVVGARGRRKAFQFPTPRPEQFPCGPVLETDISGVLNHVTRSHAAESVMRYMELDYGKRDHLGRVDRLHPLLPSKTVIAGGVSGGGRSHLHPQHPRTLSVRECARLQTFPDDFEFLGPVARQFTQVGNAVPPVLAAHLATQIRALFA